MPRPEHGLCSSHKRVSTLDSLYLRPWVRHFLDPNMDSADEVHQVDSSVNSSDESDGHAETIPSDTKELTALVKVFCLLSSMYIANVDFFTETSASEFQVPITASETHLWLYFWYKLPSLDCKPP